MDDLCFPLLKAWAESGKVGCYEVIKYEEKAAGFLMVVDGYLEGIYVKPEFRRKGLARKAVLDHIDIIQGLHIINTNETAKDFWFSILELKQKNQNPCDAYFIVKGVKH